MFLQLYAILEWNYNEFAWSTEKFNEQKLIQNHDPRNFPHIWGQLEHQISSKLFYPKQKDFVYISLLWEFLVFSRFWLFEILFA